MRLFDAQPCVAFQSEASNLKRCGHVPKRVCGVGVASELCQQRVGHGSSKPAMVPRCRPRPPDPRHQHTTSGATDTPPHHEIDHQRVSVTWHRRACARTCVSVWELGDRAGRSCAVPQRTRKPNLKA
eukprot:920156-Rhodomonas_salina.2